MTCRAVLIVNENYSTCHFDGSETMIIKLNNHNVRISRCDTIAWNAINFKGKGIKDLQQIRISNKNHDSKIISLILISFLTN